MHGSVLGFGAPAPELAWLVVDFSAQVGELRSVGYTVVRGAVPIELCRGVLGAIDRELGVRLEDPESWAKVSSRIDQVPLWSHPSQWEIRQLPHLHELWATIWQRHDLWADMNSCRFTPPWRPGNAPPLPIHFDTDPRDDNQRWFPGVVALTDADVGAGGFCCVPELFDRPDRYPTEWPRTAHGIEYLPDTNGFVVEEVPLDTGDLLVFDSRLPHGTVRNDSLTPRVVFYMQLHPPGTEAERVERLADVAAGRCPPWWRWKPGHDRLAPFPLDLSPLGRKLAAFDPWSAGS